MFAGVVVLELTAHAGANAWDNMTARLNMSLIVLMAATKRMKILSSLSIIERELELRTIIPRRWSKHKR
jgi:hypothetical protein